MVPPSSVSNTRCLNVGWAEDSAHPTFKQRVFDTEEGGTMLALKKLAPTRLIKNDFFNQVKALEDAGAEAAQLTELLGKGRAKKGIFEGDMTEGELEIGQIASMLHKEETVAEIMEDIIADFNKTTSKLGDLKL